MCKGDPVYIYAVTTAAAQDQSGLAAWSVEAVRGPQPSVDTAAGALFPITVDTLVTSQSCAATVSIAIIIIIIIKQENNEWCIVKD